MFKKEILAKFLPQKNMKDNFLKFVDKTYIELSQRGEPKITNEIKDYIYKKVQA